ncbi:hypothetical protein BJF78_30125 [Pseudonocardia sp. CNS-139]|nr:hypothetical protein BJF78_30125 [Pseudonocardia sp. CNS-139]
MTTIKNPVGSADGRGQGPGSPGPVGTCAPGSGRSEPDDYATTRATRAITRPITSVFRGTRIRYVPVREVQPGDEIACWLSDATAYVAVTGSTERVLELERHGLPNVTHIKFTSGARPWWVDDTFLTFAEGDQVPVRVRAEDSGR